MTPSFPTRRSSDLCADHGGNLLQRDAHAQIEHAVLADRVQSGHWRTQPHQVACDIRAQLHHAERFHLAIADLRSEEHTSELQSLMRISYAVFCLQQKTPTHQRHNMVSNKHT